MDSGATHHTTSNDASLTSKTEYYGSGVLTVGNGSILPISHIGNSTLTVSKPLYLRNILLVPSIKKNLSSIAKFTADNNVSVEFDASQCVVKDKLMKEILVQGYLHNGLYQLDIPLFRSTNMLPTTSSVPVCYNTSTSIDCSLLEYMLRIAEHV